MASCTSPHALLAVKITHTIVWVFFVLCIVGIPAATWRGRYWLALALIGVVAVEVLVLAINRWSCPMTPIAARFTDDRRANFDIFLPEWLARHNKTVFGLLYLAGVAYLAVAWAVGRS